ncbi:RING finger protein 32 [Podochytrium sp. JEL0797]|nr:RING finger protein 32 [Podochytrium sp. JEL0797]
MGIVGAPPQLLSKHEWSVVKEKSRSTHATFRTDCAICCEPFAALTQVILSCSHSFHKACIKSYEKHTNSKRCPLCRTVGYETLETTEAAAVFYNDAAIKIQSVWRMWILRKKYLRHRAENEPTHPLLKRKFHLDKLCVLNRTLDRQMETENSEIEHVMREMEESLQVSRDAFEKFSTIFDEPQDWEEVLDKIYKRRANPLEESCSICLCELIPPLTNEKNVIAAAADSGNMGTRKKPKRIAMLSCGHLLHEKCISNFERFNGAHVSHVCPICRFAYERTIFPLS